MNFYSIEPEVAGGFGPNAILEDPKARPPRIRHFHYEFDGWLGDPILETVASFIVTQVLKKRLEEIRATGVRFASVEISKSGEFEDLHPERELPNFIWLQINGQAGKDDFGLSSSHSLVVSERILNILLEAGMRHAEICRFGQKPGTST